MSGKLILRSLCISLFWLALVQGGDPPIGEFRTIVKCQTVLEPVVKPTPTCSCSASAKNSVGEQMPTRGTQVTYQLPETSDPKSQAPSQPDKSVADPNASQTPKRSKKVARTGMTSTSLTILVIVVILAVLLCIAVIGVLFFVVKRRTGMYCPNGRRHKSDSPTSERRLIVR